MPAADETFGWRHPDTDNKFGAPSGSVLDRVVQKSYASLRVIHQISGNAPTYPQDGAATHHQLRGEGEVRILRTATAASMAIPTVILDSPAARSPNVIGTSVILAPVRWARYVIST